MRVTSDLWVGALLRRAQAAGAFVSIQHKGAHEAGAIFVVINNLAGAFTLIGPAPQMVYETVDGGHRKFEVLIDMAAELDVLQKIDRERSFDPDIWVVEIEDRGNRPFIDELVKFKED